MVGLLTHPCIVGIVSPQKPSRLQETNVPTRMRNVITVAMLTRIIEYL